MNFWIKVGVVVLSIAFINVLFAQDCTDFHTKSCPIPDFSYYYDQQSGSFTLRDGQLGELRVIVFEKTDYFVSICTQKRHKNIQLKIFEDDSEKKLIYDNSMDGFVDSIKFSNDITKKLILEVMVTNDKTDIKERCVGILVAKRIRVDAF